MPFPAYLRPPLLVLFLLAFYSRLEAAVQIMRTPNGGIQPQAVADRAGTIHLIYFAGEPGGGDIFYVKRTRDEEKFSQPIRVNREAGSATAIGTIRGAQLALGKGRVHVVWNGHAPKGGTYMDAPMCYTRINQENTAFEPERNLITYARGLDGGGSVAADDRGNVTVFWHAPKPGNTNGEAGRALWVTRSADDGRTFARETLAVNDTGACGCCGMKAFADDAGTLFALFRGASDSTHRDEILLAGKLGEELKPILRDRWEIAACPMSSASFCEGSDSSYAAWETKGNIFFTKISGSKAEAPRCPPGNAKRKHPAMAANKSGELLLVWTEGTSWGKGGDIAWQLYASNGIPTGQQGRADGLPAWSLATAVAAGNDDFLVIY